jgi:1-deoxy-D-xylulose-5-phosphate synthase
MSKSNANSMKDLSMTPEEVRRRIIDTVSANGGHLASSLGAVELACALSRVFDPFRDRILWDVGHQAYAWKILTGRAEQFSTLRKHGGVSPFMNPAESDADAFISGHAGAAIAAAVGMAAVSDCHVVAVTGDASLSNGVSFEALNNCAQQAKKLILVLNDNEMSISRNTGAMARFLGRLISGVRYNRVKAAAERAGHRLGLTFLRGLYHRIESRIKSLWLANSFFENFGLRYIGPIDGHDLNALTAALTVAKEDKRGVVVHVITRKGKGFAPAERNPTAWHGVGPFDPTAALSAAGDYAPKSSGSWSDVFGAAMVAAARRDPKVHVVVAAMKDGTGLAEFAREFPDRFHDVGICEEFAVTFAAGLAKAGVKPVVAVYSTFLQRAIGQIQHDVCLQNLPVVFAVDRAGCVGADGATHHGLYDIALLKTLPNIQMFSPVCADELCERLDCALAAADAPTVIRYPRGKATERRSLPPVDDAAEGAKVRIFALGDQVAKAVRVKELLSEKGVMAQVLPVSCVKPVPEWIAPALLGVLSVTLENGAVMGGFGESVGADMKFGWPDRPVAHGTLEELEKECGFDAAAIAEAIWQKSMV